MKELFKRHQVATWERGLIQPKTNILDFERKINDEYYELRNAIADHLAEANTFSIAPDIVHEAVDLCAVCINMLTFYGIDFETEYKKNVELQESRVNGISRLSTDEA